MARCLEEGRWFGNAPVGLHGFLFKLPAALVFLATGPSVTAATFINILYAMLAAWLCYLIFLRVTTSSQWALAGALLLITSYHFIDTLPTFLREIPALLSVLVLLYGIVTKKKLLWTIIGLLLILDSREILYFMILPGLWLYIIWSRRHEGKKKIITLSLACLLPFFVTAMLMLFTGLVPLNPRIPYILGLHEGGFLRALQWKFASTGLPLPLQPATWLSPTGVDGSAAATWFWSLLTHLLGPKGLSLVSIPKFILIPAIAMGWRLQKQWLRNIASPMAAFPFMALPPLTLVILTRSSGRHLLPFAPILILSFILFIRDGIRDIRFFRRVLIVTSAAIAGEMFFPHPKLLLNLTLQALVIIALWAYYFLRSQSEKKLVLIAWVPIAIIALTTFGSAIGASVLLPGQIGRTLTWGRHSQIPLIVTHLPRQKPVWINANPLLVSFFTHQDFFPPNLARQYFQNFFHIPKSRRIKPPHPQLIHSFHWGDIDDFIYNLGQQGIDTVIMVSSTTKSKKFRFPMQDLRSILEAHPAFLLKNTFTLKNKQIHIFHLPPLSGGESGFAL